MVRFQFCTFYGMPTAPSPLPLPSPSPHPFFNWLKARPLLNKEPPLNRRNTRVAPVSRRGGVGGGGDGFWVCNVAPQNKTLEEEEDERKRYAEAQRVIADVKVAVHALCLRPPRPPPRTSATSPALTHAHGREEYPQRLHKAVFFLFGILAFELFFLGELSRESTWLPTPTWCMLRCCHHRRKA